MPKLEKSQHYQTGRQGERIAEEFLRHKGYTLLTRNYRSGRGEIDLVVRQKDLLIFVEVKTRHLSGFGHPEEAISAAKQAMLLQTADAYVHQHDWKGRQRFDVIAIELGEHPVIAHFTDALA